MSEAKIDKAVKTALSTKHSFNEVKFAKKNSGVFGIGAGHKSDKFVKAA
jgi:hypothetical protein